jgi:hypothetical protein
MIPKPFAHVRILYGPPFEVEPGETGFAEAVKRATAGLQEVSGTGAWHEEAIATG